MLQEEVCRNLCFFPGQTATSHRHYAHNARIIPIGSNSVETPTLGTGGKSRALDVYMEHNGTMFWLRCFQKPFLHLARTKEVQLLRKIRTLFSLQPGVLFQKI